MKDEHLCIVLSLAFVIDILLFIEFVAANITHLLFRSDRDATNNGLGFIAYMVCFRPEDNHLTGTIQSQIICRYNYVVKDEKPNPISFYSMRI